MKAGMLRRFLLCLPCWRRVPPRRRSGGITNAPAPPSKPARSAPVRAAGEVERRYRGRVIEADLERDDNQWLYEFKILPSNGRVFRVELDAATGAFLRSHGPVQERASGEPRR
jgi:hypothetical protein